MDAFPSEYTHLNSILLSKSLILSTKKHVSMIDPEEPNLKIKAEPEPEKCFCTMGLSSGQ